MGVCASRKRGSHASHDHPTAGDRMMHSGENNLQDASSEFPPGSVHQDSDSLGDAVKLFGVPEVPGTLLASADTARLPSHRPDVVAKTPTEGPTVPNQTSPLGLEESRRRRLSVSTTLRREGEVPEGDTETDLPSRSSSCPQGPPTENPPTVALRTPEQCVLRSKIKHFIDPSLELIDEKAGTIKVVTVEMLMDLVIGCNSTYMVFGAASAGTQQRGFENKKVTIVGTLAGKFEPSTSGLGFACKKGLKPESPNQDDYFIIRVDDWCLYGVFDGHGPYGHEVSNFVHRMVPFLVMGDLLFETDPCLVMRRAFRKAHHLLEAMSNSSDFKLDCTLSGTTGTLVLYRDHKLFVAHVGDSRSVLARQIAGRTEAVDLTVDHKPTREDERIRIEASGGEVRQLEGDIPHRVFVRRRMYPGLAMTRAIGDSIGAAVGVIPDPEVKVVDIGNDSPCAEQFVIIATDGVWEFISSQEAVDYICQKGRADVQRAAEFLAYESWRRWVEEEENVVDDVTCIVFWV